MSQKLLQKPLGWIANLSSVVLSGEVYSALKNMEVAETITAKQQDVLEIKERLSLKRYAQQVSMESILRRLHFEEQDIAKLKDSVEKTEIDLKRAIPSARKYAYINAGVQLIPGVAIVVINSLANLEQPPQASSEDDSSGLTTKQWLNLILAGGLIIAQYFTHSSYAAQNLRKEFDEIKATHDKLDKAQNHLFFRAVEFDAFIRYKNSLEAEISRCDVTIELVTALNTEITPDNITITTERLSVLLQEHERPMDREIIANLSHKINESSAPLNTLELLKIIEEQINTREALTKKLTQIMQIIDNQPERIEELARDFEDGYRIFSTHPQ